MVIEKTTNDGIAIKDSDGDILHIVKAREVYLQIHPRNGEGVIISATPSRQDDAEGIVVYSNRVTSIDGTAFSGSRSDLITKLDELFLNGGSAGSSGAQGSVATINDLPAAAGESGKYFWVNEGSGGLVVGGFRIGGNDPGMYYSDGISWDGPRRDIDPANIKLNPASYNKITADNLKDGIIELETAIDNANRFLANTLRLTATSTHKYWIGDRTDGSWKVNRLTLADGTQSSATESNNSGVTTRAAAQSNYLTLNYA